MPDNVVSVDLQVVDEERARAAFQGLKSDMAEVAASDPFSGLSRSAKVSSDEIEASFGRSKASAVSLSAEFSRSAQSTQGQTLSLQRSFQQLAGSSPFAPIAAQSKQAAGEVYLLQQRIAGIYRGQAEGRPLAELKRELDDAIVRAEALKAQMFELQSARRDPTRIRVWQMNQRAGTRNE